MQNKSLSLPSGRTLVLLAFIVISAGSSARGDITFVDPIYNATTYYTGTSSDNIVSYDWDSSQNLYYTTSTSSFNFGGFYQYTGTATNTLASGSSAFSGASVVTVGGFVYYNDGNGQIYNYGPTGGTPAINAISTTPNFGLYGHNGQLFISGSPDFGTNHIYNSALNTNGTLVSNPATDLGADAGSSGPLAFDSQGNLYYAPGFGDLSIYKWSAADIAAALANPGTSPLTAAGHQWLDYSSLYGTVSGGSSLLVDNGQLLVTLTNFSGPSDLVAFGINGSGASDGTATTILQDATNPLGELRSHNGGLFLSDGNTVFALNTPEPSSVLLLGMGLLVLTGIVWHRNRIDKLSL